MVGSSLATLGDKNATRDWKTLPPNEPWITFAEGEEVFEKQHPA